MPPRACWVSAATARRPFSTRTTDPTCASRRRCSTMTAMNLERFARDCHDILEADAGPAGREKVRALLEQALLDREFIEATLGEKTPERHVLYEDPDLGF